MRCFACWRILPEGKIRCRDHTGRNKSEMRNGKMERKRESSKIIEDL